MACSDGGHPGKNEDERWQADFNCPDCTQKSDPVFPWQENDEETTKKVGYDAEGNKISTGVGDAGRKLKSQSA